MYSKNMPAAFYTVYIHTHSCQCQNLCLCLYGTTEVYFYNELIHSCQYTHTHTQFVKHLYIHSIHADRERGKSMLVLFGYNSCILWVILSTSVVFVPVFVCAISFCNEKRVESILIILMYNIIKFMIQKQNCV